MTSIHIVEDNSETRRYLEALFSGAPGFSTVISSGSVDEAMAVLEQVQPDVLLTDLSLPGMSGIDLINIMRSRHMTMEIVVLTMHEDREHLLQSLKAGASGYILKGASSVEIIRAVEEVMAGGAPMSPRIARYLVDEFKGHNTGEPNGMLTAREIAVLGGIAGGTAEKRLASDLAISRHTLHTHIKNIYRKLQVNSRIEAVNKARKKGII